MSSQLWMLRHAEAVPHGVKPDEQRELTPRGHEQSRIAGAALAALEIELAACYTSPKVRAVETAQGACERLGVEPQVVAAIGAGFSRADALELLYAHAGDERVLVVGHEPSFSQVVPDLCGARVDFKKGGIAVVRAGRASGELLALLRPRELAAIAGVAAV
jgi:phosphohistidine phosphatase